MLSSQRSMLKKVDEFIADNLDQYYPGSKRKKKSALTPQPVKIDKNNWEESPHSKTLPSGKTVELFSMGALGVALGRRPLVTLRLWERKGFIPKAPYRVRSSVIDGKKKPGWRMYSRDMIVSAVESFQSRGLLDSKRIDWSRHQDLSIELVENWTAILKEEMTPNA
jgi:hypothetical protein